MAVFLSDQYRISCYIMSDGHHKHIGCTHSKFMFHLALFKFGVHGSINTSALFKRNSAGCMGGAISSPSNATFELLKGARFQANTVAYVSYAT